MIRCLIQLDSAGCLESFEAAGHALGHPGVMTEPGGGDLVCAAVTTLLRTTSRMLYRHPAIGAEGDAQQPGSMRLKVGAIAEEWHPWLRGVTDFLLEGLRDIQTEYPRNLQLVIRRKGTDHHGT